MTTRKPPTTAGHHHPAEDSIQKLVNHKNEVGSLIQSNRDLEREWLEKAVKTYKRKLLESVMDPRIVKKLKLDLKPVVAVETTNISNTATTETHNNNNTNNKLDITNCTKEEEQTVEAVTVNELDVMSLKVVELRKECRNRSLKTDGLKKDLQERLLSFLRDEELRRRQQYPSHTTNNEGNMDMEDASSVNNNSNMDRNSSSSINSGAVDFQNGHKPPEVCNNTSHNNVLSSSSSEAKTKAMESMNQNDHHQQQQTLLSTKSEATAAFFDAMDIVVSPKKPAPSSSDAPVAATTQTVNNKDGTIDVTIEKSAGTLSSSSEQEMNKNKLKTKSPARKAFGKVMKPIKKMFSPSPKKKKQQQIVDGGNTTRSMAPPPPVKQNSFDDRSDGSYKHSVTSVGRVQSEVDRIDSDTMTGSQQLQQLHKNSGVSIVTTSSSSTSSATHSSKESKKLQQSSTKQQAYNQNEALDKKRARIEEMRMKARNEIQQQKAQMKSHLKPTNNNSATSKMMMISSKSSIASSSTKSFTSQSSNKSSHSTASGAASSTISKENQQERSKLLLEQMRERAKLANEVKKLQHQQGVKVPSSTVPQSLLKKHVNNDNGDAIVNPPTIQSPLDTYEISDKEGSDSDSDESEYEKPKKRIPDWARSANLFPALERQFKDGPDRIDPDSIFGDVTTCNLEEIFDQRKTRFNRRTSSGNWTKDKVTILEKMNYRRQMGYR